MRGSNKGLLETPVAVAAVAETSVSFLIRTTLVLVLDLDLVLDLLEVCRDTFAVAVPTAFTWLVLALPCFLFDILYCLDPGLEGIVPVDSSSFLSLRIPGVPGGVESALSGWTNFFGFFLDASKKFTQSDVSSLKSCSLFRRATITSLSVPRKREGVDHAGAGGDTSLDKSKAPDLFLLYVSV